MPTASQKVFKRIEKKYLISAEQYDSIMDTIRLHTIPDTNRNERIFSLYFDTPTYTLIRRSIDKPVYKEKLRLRAYGMPDENAQVFAEIKKKYKKVVYKRRAVMNYCDALNFLATGQIPPGYEDQHQILSEIQWFVRSYHGLSPSILISYDRQAYIGTEDPKLRITFDGNITWSDRNPETEENTHEKSFPDMVSGFSNSSMKNSTACIQADCGSGSAESTMNNSTCPCPNLSNKNLKEASENLPLLDEGQMIMEIKIPGAMPLWLTGLLAENSIYPTSFSKVGTAYKQKLSKEI